MLVKKTHYKKKEIIFYSYEEKCPKRSSENLKETRLFRIKRIEVQVKVRGDLYRKLFSNNNGFSCI